MGWGRAGACWLVGAQIRQGEGAYPPSTTCVAISNGRRPATRALKGGTNCLVALVLFLSILTDFGGLF